MLNKIAMIIAAIIFTSFPAAAQCIPFTETFQDPALFLFKEGVEISAGTYESGTGNVGGNSFALNSFDDKMSRHLSVSLDYATNGFNPANSVITGGSWSLAFIREGEYIGTVYGVVTGGGIEEAEPAAERLRPEKESVRTVVAELRSTGGLGLLTACGGLIGKFEASAIGSEVSGLISF